MRLDSGDGLPRQPYLLRPRHRLLLRRLAVDAQRRGGPGFQQAPTDLSAALFTLSVGNVVRPPEHALDPLCIRCPTNAAGEGFGSTSEVFGLVSLAGAQESLQFLDEIGPTGQRRLGLGG